MKREKGNMRYKIQLERHFITTTNFSIITTKYHVVRVRDHLGLSAGHHSLLVSELLGAIRSTDAEKRKLSYEKRSTAARRPVRLLTLQARARRSRSLQRSRPQATRRHGQQQHQQHQQQRCHKLNRGVRKDCSNSKQHSNKRVGRRKIHSRSGHAAHTAPSERDVRQAAAPSGSAKRHTPMGSEETRPSPPPSHRLCFRKSWVYVSFCVFVLDYFQTLTVIIIQVNI